MHGWLGVAVGTATVTGTGEVPLDMVHLQTTYPTGPVIVRLAAAPDFDKQQPKVPRTGLYLPEGLQCPRYGLLKGRAALPYIASAPFLSVTPV